MPKMSEAFPSKYLKADDDVPDMSDGGLDVTIKDAEFETIGMGKDAEEKVIVYFNELKKGLVLNKTNATTITKLLKSDDTDDWIGQRLRIGATDVEFKGEMTRGIRVSTRQPTAPGSRRRDFDETAPATPVAAKAAGDDDASDVPF